MWEADLAGGAVARPRRRGQGPAAARAPHLRRRGLDPAARAGRVAERQRRGGAAALRGARQRSAVADADALPLRRLQPPPRGRVRGPRELVDPLASFVAAERRARRASSSTASATTRRSARSRSASPSTPTRCSSGSRPSTADASASASSPPTSPCAAPPGRRCGSVSSRTFLARPRRRRGTTDRRRSQLGDRARRRDARTPRAAPPRRKWSGYSPTQ